MEERVSYKLISRHFLNPSKTSIFKLSSLKNASFPSHYFYQGWRGQKNKNTERNCSWAPPVIRVLPQVLRGRLAKTVTSPVTYTRVNSSDSPRILLYLMPKNTTEKYTRNLTYMQGLTKQQIAFVISMHILFYILVMRQTEKAQKQ